MLPLDVWSKNRRKEHERQEEIDTLREKAKKYDELQSWWWWLERRTHNGKTTNGNIRTFLNGIEEYFESYEEENK
jgi:hypothetical protein